MNSAHINFPLLSAGASFSKLTYHTHRAQTHPCASAINVLSAYSIVSLAVADSLIALFESCKRDAKADKATNHKVLESESVGSPPTATSNNNCSGKAITRLCRFVTAIVSVWEG